MFKDKQKARCIIYFLVACLVAIFAMFFVNKKDTQKADLGGEIFLQDVAGKQFSLQESDKDLSVVFFGFTHCPSFCPMALEQMTDALNLLGEDDLDEVNVLFITVDPVRDTQEIMAEYLQHFHASIKGLTGEKEDVSKVLANYRVYSQKVAEEDNLHGYTMDHSTYIYFVDEDGNYLEHLEYDADPEEIKLIIKKYI